MKGKLQRKFDCTKEFYWPHEILPVIRTMVRVPDEKMHRVEREVIDGDPVTVTSVRLRTFKTYGTTCVKCGIEGVFFRKEKNLNDIVYHLNLYAIDDIGREVLMTKDHIVPKSKGGKDFIGNMQPMCVRCNTQKDNKETKDYRK